MTDGAVDPDQKSRTRMHAGWLGVVQRLVLAAMPVLGVVFLLGWHTDLGITIYQEQWVGLLLSLFLVGTFLTVPASTNSARSTLAWYDVLLALAGTVPGGYLAWQYPEMVLTLGLQSPGRTWLGLLTLLLAGEALRRLVGWSLLIVLVAFLTYAMTAASFPGFMRGQQVGFDRLMNYIYVDPSAILGLVGLAATFGVAFVFFGQVLLHFGAGAVMTDVSLLAFARVRGGASKSAVVGSSLAGTISGGAMSNVLLTGTITIPMMIRAGYRSRVAGAIEALASTGGQIMPPVMGIAAFLIADSLGMPYSEVALAALIPAILIYLALFIMTDLESGRTGIARLPASEVPNTRSTLSRAWILVPTIGLLIYLLFVARMEPSRAAVTAALLAIPVMLLVAENRKQLPRKLAKMLSDTGVVLLDLVGVLVAAGVVVGVISMTGLGFQFAYGALDAAGGNVAIILIVAALASIVLGMGMPSVAAYALVAVLIVPALVEGGIEPIAAHMFVFYFAVISNITPPICLAVFAAATLADAKQMQTAWSAVRLGWAFFLVPFLFVMSPSLLLADTAAQTAISTVVAVVGIVLVSIGVAGFLRRALGSPERLLLIAAGLVLLLVPAEGGGLFVNASAALIGAVVCGARGMKPDFGGPNAGSGLVEGSWPSSDSPALTP